MIAKKKISAVGVYPNFAKRRCRQVFAELVSWLDRRGCEVWVSDQLDGHLPEPLHRASPQELPRRIELLVVLGGDGTLLSASRSLYPHEVPILGVNFGGLGFLADVNVRELFPALERALEGNFAIDRRLMLEVAVLSSGGRSRARLHGLNDAVIHETGHRLTELALTVGGARVGVFKADGVVIASPTGSTAYSLSAGGPILQPKLDAMVAVPICAHMLAVRPLIVHATETIIVEPTAGAEVNLAVDGQVSLDLRAGESVRVRRAAHRSCFVQLRERSFYELLREKMKWGA